MKVNKGGMLVYKCRSCGKMYEAVHIPDVMLALISISCNWDEENVFNQKKDFEWLREFVGTKLTDIHSCKKKNQLGIADLIRGEIDNETK